MSKYILRTKVKTNDTSLPFAKRDQLLVGDNGGVLQVFDFGFGWSYPAGDLPRPAPTNPANGDLIRDVAEKGNASVLSSSAGSVFTYEGGGVTHAAETQTGSSHNYSLISTSGNLAGFTQSTKYLVTCYLKLATLADFNSSGSIAPFVSACSDNGENYANGVELVTIATNTISNGVGGITARFQTSIGNVTRLDINLPNGVGLYGGDIVQVAAWFDGTDVFLRVKSDGFEETASSPHSGNTENLTSNSVKFETSSGNFGGTSVPHKLYRCFMENLTISGRDAVSVLDSDLSRTVSRNVFS